MLHAIGPEATGRDEANTLTGTNTASRVQWVLAKRYGRKYFFLISGMFNLHRRLLQPLLPPVLLLQALALLQTREPIYFPPSVQTV